MSEVITRLKVDNAGYDQKIRQAQRGLEQFGIKGTEVGQKMSGLGRALSVNIGQISKLSVGLGAASAAAKVASDAFKQNEVMMDEWGRITASSKSVYEGFLNSLNTGDITGYISNISNIVQAARDAYDALDDLSTFNAFNQINTERARTNLTNAMAGYRTGDVTKSELQSAADEMKRQLETRGKFEKQAYEARIRELAASRGVDEDLLKKAMSGSFGDYQSLKDLPLSKTVMKTQSMGAYGGTYSYEVQEAANEQEKLGEMLRHLTDEELNSLQALGVQAQRTATEIANVDKQTARMLGQKKVENAITNTSGRNTTELVAGSIAAQEEEVKRLREQFQNAGADVQGVFFEALDRAEKKLQEMRDMAAQMGKTLKSAFDPQPPASLELELANMNTKLHETGEEHVKVAKGSGSAWNYVSSSIGSVGAALGSLENPGARVAGIIAEAIANIAAGYAAAVGKAGETGDAGGPWGWVAFAASGAATMISSIAAIKQATEYHAEGGFVGGGPRGTDTVNTWLTPGELVLNRAQQNNLAAQLAPAGGYDVRNFHLETSFEAERVRVMLVNNSKRRGGTGKNFSIQ